VFAADVDSDGDLDVLSATSGDDKIAWYENDGSGNFSEHTINTAADRAYSVFAADVDGDDDLDVLSASRNDDKIPWYNNLGNDPVVSHQIVTPTQASQTTMVGGSFTFDAIYTTDQLDDTLTGLELRLHFDTTQVQFDGLTNVLQTSLFLAKSVEADTDDFDADPATDMFVSVAWTDFGGAWPGVGNLPSMLYTANFTALVVGCKQRSENVAPGGKWQIELKT
jgi:hypothetical protein